MMENIKLSGILTGITGSFKGAITTMFYVGVIENVILDLEVQYGGREYVGAFVGEVKATAQIRNSINIGSNTVEFGSNLKDEDGNIKPLGNQKCFGGIAGGCRSK